MEKVLEAFGTWFPSSEGSRAQRVRQTPPPIDLRQSSRITNDIATVGIPYQCERDAATRNRTTNRRKIVALVHQSSYSQARPQPEGRQLGSFHLWVHNNYCTHNSILCALCTHNVQHE